MNAFALFSETNCVVGIRSVTEKSFFFERGIDLHTPISSFALFVHPVVKSLFFDILS